MGYKVLITEAINEKGIDFLRDQGYEIVMGTGPSEETLLKELAGCEAHSSVILSNVDDSVLRRLKVNLTCEPVYETNKLYHR